MKLEKNMQSLNEVIVGSSRPDVAKLLSRLKSEGRVARLAPRVYTTNMTDSPEAVVRRNLWTIIGKLWPGARLSHRAALEYAPRDADSHDILGTYAVTSNRREMSRAIRHPFARAVFVLFVTSEVHPFADGNGRISRIMMNAELTAAGQAKIIVPTVFRPDYIGALRRLSRNAEPGVLVDAMSRLWNFSRRLSGADFETMRRQLEAANAFSDDDSDILRL